MAVNTNTIVSNVYAQNYTPGSKEKTKVARNTETGEVKKEEKVTESKDLGKTIGDPKLSKEAQKYYEKLKKNNVMNKIINVLEPIAMLGMLLIVTAYLVDNSYNPFLYFRF